MMDVRERLLAAKLGLLAVSASEDRGIGGGILEVPHQVLDPCRCVDVLPEGGVVAAEVRLCC